MSRALGRLRESFSSRGARPPSASRRLRLGAAVGLVGVCVAPFASRFEELGLDLLFRLRGPRTVPADVLVVALDYESAEALRLDPAPARWPRSLHARLIRGLAERGAAVVAYDVFFREPKEPAQDLRFASALAQAGRVVLCCGLDADVLPIETAGATVEKLVRPARLLADSALAVAPWPLPKPPAKVTHFWAFKEGAGGAPTLPAVALQAFALDAYPELIRRLVACGGCPPGAFPDTFSEVERTGEAQEVVRRLREAFRAARLPAEGALPHPGGPAQSFDPRRERLLGALFRLYRGGDVRCLNYYGPARTVPTVPCAKVLADLAAPPGRGRLDFRGKAVFVGLSDLSWPRQKDSFHTPYTRADGLELSGVEIAATAFANLLEGSFVRPLGPAVHLPVLFLWGLLAGSVALSARAVPAFAALAALGAGWTGLGLAAFRADGRWLPLAVPLLLQVPLAVLGAVLGKYGAARKEREEIATAAKQYLPERLVEGFAEVGSGRGVEDEEVYAVCLLTDAKRYATVAESLQKEGGPGELRRWLNRYFDAVFRPILARGGYVVDVAGDSMLGLWRCDPPDAERREQACLAAVEVQEAVDDFNRFAGDHALPTRIGLDLGCVSLGSVGAAGRLAYRATGNPVNTAARLEALNKHLGTRTLASGPVVSRLEGIPARCLGDFLLPGLSEAVTVFELRGRADADAEEERRLGAAFAEGLCAFRARRWADAAAAFRRNPPDGPSAFYLRLCERYLSDPPPEGWDGAIRLEQK